MAATKIDERERKRRQRLRKRRREVSIEYTLTGSSTVYHDVQLYVSELVR